MNKSEATVLIIDDDAEIRYSLDRVLVSQGLQVITADSGEKGIETAKAEKPTLIFLDNRMGGYQPLLFLLIVDPIKLHLQPFV